MDRQTDNEVLVDLREIRAELEEARDDLRKIRATLDLLGGSEDEYAEIEIAEHENKTLLERLQLLEKLAAMSN